MYKLFVFGLNYETAGFEMREKIAFSEDEINHTLKRLQDSHITREALILSTCNRTEVYCITEDIDFVINAICDVQNICPRSVKKHSYVYKDDECVRHLFRVISGLESMILGETEIVAQVKHALNLARNINSIATELLAVFNMGLSLEKDVRNYTAINNIGISMGNAIINLVAVHCENLIQSKILFVGSGVMMNQIAPHFKNIQCQEKTIINRTLHKAQSLADRIYASALPLEELQTVVNDYDVIIICSSSDKPLITSDVLRNRLNRSEKTIIIDVSMPLVADLNLKNEPLITFLTIDDIAKIVDIGVAKRQLAANDAQQIIDEKLIEYTAWKKKREFTPIIRAIRDNAETMRLDLVENAYKQLQNGEDVKLVLNSLSNKLMNKLLHSPTVNLCAAEGRLQEDLASLVSLLYDLKI